jgi:hypothetical protein
MVRPEQAPRSRAGARERITLELLLLHLPHGLIERSQDQQPRPDDPHQAIT